MIVLDEQLLGRNLEAEIADWYEGKVCFITDLRPNTVIKDDAIPKLLREQNHAAFITINEKDFWRKVKIAEDFCLICFAFPDSRADEISSALRSLFRHPLFHTKSQRMGKVIRVAAPTINYYSFDDKRIRNIE